MISERDIETIYLKFLISIAEEIAMSIIEAITDIEAIIDANSIIDEIETLLSNERNVVDEFANVIWERKFNEKNSIFMMNWFNIDADCQKFENRAMMKIRMMFEKLLICVFFSLSFDQRKLVLYFFRIVLFTFFAQTVAQIAVALFFYNNISFKNQIFLVLSLYISLALCIRHTMFHLKIIHSCFHRKETYFESISSFSFVKVSSFNFFLCRFNLFVSLSVVVLMSVVALMFEILCRSMFSFCLRILWFWSKTFEFDVLLCCRLFEKRIRRCFCFSRTLLCFNILLSFAHSEDSFFSVFEDFSARSSMWKYEKCVRKNWWWIEKINESK